MSLKIAWFNTKECIKEYGSIGKRLFELYPKSNVVWGDKSWVKFKDKIANGHLRMSAVGSNISMKVVKRI